MRVRRSSGVRRALKPPATAPPDSRKTKTTRNAMIAISNRALES
jgi:hypothetical protein